MLKRSIASMLLLIAATLAYGGHAAPAHADPVGVNSCTATAPGDHGRASCTFVATPGYYRLDLYSNARYAWAEVTCTPSGYIFVDVWDTEGGYDWSDGYLQGVCTLLVAAGAGGPATAYVTKY